MNRFKLWATGFGSIAAVFVLSAAPSGPVYAQADEDIEEVLEEIITTGSRIKRTDFSSMSPLTVLGGQGLLEQGVSNLGEALRDQPSIGTGGFNQSSILSGGGATSIDLRNLGSDRVLILINGRRVASFADALQNQAADLSFVPTAMIDRVEILRDGASAVYGSDAITGVVNVILKKDFEGVEVSLNTGASTESDGEGYGVSLTMGASNDRGSFVAGAEWRRRDLVKQRDRDWAFPAISSLTSGGASNGSFFSPGGFFEGAAAPFDFFCTQPLAFGGNEIDDVSQTTGCPSLMPRQNVSHPDDVQLLRYDYALAQDLIVENEVITAAVYGNYQLTDATNVFMEVQYANREGTSHLDGNPGIFFVPATNPNNPLGVDAFQFIRPATTIGPRTQDTASTTFRIVAGVEGDLPFGEDWSYEASILYTSVNADLLTSYVWNVPRTEKISDPVACAADPLCAAAVNPSGALDAARPGNWTDQEIRYMRQAAQAISKFDLVGASAFVSGPLFEMPAGTLNMAFGLETRRETGFAKPDSTTEAGESIANQTFTTRGSYETDEVFVEFDIPLLADVTAFQNLDLNLQYRFTDYSSFGGDDAWRAGFNWAVNDWVRLRASVSTAYRAPSVTDLFSGGVASFDFFTDPCEAGTSGIVPTDNAWQNCVLDGIADPATFTQLSSQYAVIAGGNPNLDPETADTFTYGIVFTPLGVLEGLQISVDVWDISVDNLIGRASSDGQLDACYEGPVGLTAPECSQYQGRDPQGRPIDFINFTTNFPDEPVETNGIDIGINYVFETGSTAWNLAFNAVFTDENTFYSETPSASNRGSQPDVQISTRVDMFLNDWSFSWLMRHVGEMNDTRFDGTNPFGYDVVDAYYKHDLRASYDWERYRLAVGINNITDEDPPYMFGSGNNTDTFLYDVFGTYWYARLTFSL